MKKIAMFFKGLKQVKDSWFAVLILLFTCFVGTISVGFCYRTAVFYIRQPESNYTYAGSKAIAYDFANGIANVDADMDLPGYLGVIAGAQFQHGKEAHDLTLLCEDIYAEEVLDFAATEPCIVVNERVEASVGDIVKVGKINMKVVGKTPRSSYTNIRNFDKISGHVTYYFDKQLTRSQMTALEKATGAKLNRDLNWQGKLSAQNYMFIALGVAVMALISVNVARLCNLYQRKNAMRYRLYSMVGMSEARLTLTKLGEMAILLLLCLPLPLLIDGLALRPLSMLLGITYMYDAFDVFVVSACVFVPFILVVAAQLAWQAARKIKWKRG